MILSPSSVKKKQVLISKMDGSSNFNTPKNWGFNTPMSQKKPNVNIPDLKLESVVSFSTYA